MDEHVPFLLGLKESLANMGVQMFLSLKQLGIFLLMY
jgi:hypothetical protein